MYSSGRSCVKLISRQDLRLRVALPLEAARSVAGNRQTNDLEKFPALQTESFGKINGNRGAVPHTTAE